MIIAKIIIAIMTMKVDLTSFGRLGQLTFFNSPLTARKKTLTFFVTSFALQIISFIVNIQSRTFHVVDYKE
jgi:hypothetical protein